MPVVGQEIEIYAVDTFAVGSINELTSGTMGHGVCFSVGVSSGNSVGGAVRLEYAQNLLNSNSYVVSWTNVIAAAGIQGRLNVASFMNLMPELDVGFSFNFANPESNTQGPWTDLVFQACCAFEFFAPSQEAPRLLFTLTPFYRLQVELDALSHFPGLICGLKLPL